MKKFKCSKSLRLAANCREILHFEEGKEYEVVDEVYDRLEKLGVICDKKIAKEDKERFDTKEDKSISKRKTKKAE